MSANIPAVDLAALHTAISSALTAQFSGVRVDYYTRQPEPLNPPCIFFELTNFEPANPDDLGCEQLEADLHFAAECVTSYKQGGLIAARILASSVAAFIQRQRWGCPVTPAKVTDSMPENFYPKNVAYESWTVKWTHTAALGSDLWNDTGATLVGGMASECPIVGAPFAREFDTIYPAYSSPDQPDQPDVTFS